MAVFINGSFREHMKKEINSKAKRQSDLKYNKGTAEKLLRRVNISSKTRKVVAHLMTSLMEECPSNKGMMSGIRYKLFKDDSAVIEIGGFVTPYIIHLGYPLTRRPTNHAGWVERAIEKSADYISSSGYILEEPIVTYGKTIIELTNFDF